MKIHLELIEHRGEKRIRLNFERNATIIAKIKQIKGRKWSQTKKCWHLPYIKAAFEELQTMFGNDLVLPDGKKPLTNQHALEEKVSIASTISNEKIEIEPEHDFRVKIFVPWQRKDWIEKIKSLPDRAWNMTQKYWSVPKKRQTLQQLQMLFGEHLKINPNIQWGGSSISTKDTKTIFNDAFAEVKIAVPVLSDKKDMPIKIQSVEIEKDGRKTKVLVGQKVVVEAGEKSRLNVFVPYDKKGWIEVVKNIPTRKWNVEEKYWSIPYVKQSFSYLEKYFGNQVVFNLSIAENIPDHFPALPFERKKVQKNKIDLSVEQKHSLNQLENQLRLEGKEWNTIKSYRNHFKHFLAFYSKTNPAEINTEQIKKYLTVQLQEKFIANSTYNQILNALKAYYERVLKQSKKTANIPRPPKKRKLPNVMSKEEVAHVLQQIENPKHKVIVATMYACGLRVGEVVKLKLGDLNFDTKRLFVKSGKGNKDRYTILPKKTISLLKQYIQDSKVDDWLFEGQYGASYSVRSVQSIVKRAVAKARIKRRITAHSFRHAFTTHLHDFGYSVEQIRLWLGHEDINTTQGYLHIGNEDTGNSKSPFDSMEI